MSERRAAWSPVFEAGQVITADELNQLRRMLDERDHFGTRHFHGHGILYGLGVSLDREGDEWSSAPWSTSGPTHRSHPRCCMARFTSTRLHRHPWRENRHGPCQNLRASPGSRTLNQWIKSPLLYH